MNQNKIKLYARALVEAVLKPEADESKIKDNFIKFLQKNGDMSKAGQIVSLAKKIFIKKTGRRQLTIESARKIKAKQKELVESILRKGDIVDEKINKDLLAGIKIIIDGEKQFDASMQKKLQNIF
ncbi:MAG: F0F1 ATP synthase subunit delta [Patescibacteria group bacterium]